MTSEPAADFASRTLQAYERWAPAYPPVAHNPLMRAEQEAMLRLWPAVMGRRVLDLACGSGRYSQLLKAAQASDVIAIDFCLAMLQQVDGAHQVCGSMMELPFAASTFDVVVSGLALGHATDIAPWADEMARVLRNQGVLLYSDFHPAAAHAGLPRTFRDANNQVVTVPHRCFELNAQFGALESAGLKIEAVDTVRVGYELQEPFTNSESFYDRWHGLPLVLVVRARK